MCKSLVANHCVIILCDSCDHGFPDRYRGLIGFLILNLKKQLFGSGLHVGRYIVVPLAPVQCKTLFVTLQEYLNDSPTSTLSIPDFVKSQQLTHLFVISIVGPVQETIITFSKSRTAKRAPI